MAKANNKRKIVFAFLRALIIVTVAHYALVYFLPPSPSTVASPSSLSNDTSPQPNGSGDDAIINNTTLAEEKGGGATSVEISPDGQILVTPPTETVDKEMEEEEEKEKKEKKPKEPKVKIVKVTKEQTVTKYVKRTTLSDEQKEKIEDMKLELEKNELPESRTYLAVEYVLDLHSEHDVLLDKTKKEVDALVEQTSEMKKHIRESLQQSHHYKYVPIASSVLKSAVSGITSILRVNSFIDVADDELKSSFEYALLQLKSLLDDTVLTEDYDGTQVRLLDVLDQVWDASEVKMGEPATCESSFLKRELTIEVEDGPDNAEEEEEEIEEGVARESDMKALVEEIELLCQNRQKFLQKGSVDSEGNALSPIREEGINSQRKIASDYLNRKMIKVMNKRDQRRFESQLDDKREDQNLKDRLAQIEQDRITQYCAEPVIIQSMVHKGFDAILKKKDIASSILSVTPFNENVKLKPVELPDHAYFADDSLTSNLSSSWKHRGSLRLAIDKPLLYKSLSGLDKLLEYIEGYSDHVDHAIDLIANWGKDDEERYNSDDPYDGSVGKTARKVLLDAFGKMKIPTEGDVGEQAREMKEKAGILYSGV